MYKGLLIVYLLLGVQVIFLPSIGYAEEVQVVPQVEAKFYESLRDEIKKSYTSLMQMKEAQESDHHVLTEKDQEAFDDAKIALEVKLILFRNFYQSSAIQREDVRESLLQLFAKNHITMEDLQALKSLVSVQK